MTRGFVTALTMFAVLFDRLSNLPCVLAEGDEPPSTEEKLAESTSAEEKPATNMTEAEALALRQEVEAAEAKAAEAVKRSQESGQTVRNSVAKLQERLKGMKAVLAEQGEDADPAFRERVERLESEIKEITDEFGDPSDAPSASDFDNLLSGCTIMSLKELGMQRQATLVALRSAAENEMSLEEAAQTELWRMVGACITGFTEEEFSKYKAGSMTDLPEKYVEASKQPAAEETTRNLDAKIWKELQRVAKEIIGLQKLQSDDAPLPTSYGLLAMIPLVLALFFLGKLYRDTQQRQEEKRKKKEKKDAKKSR